MITELHPLMSEYREYLKKYDSVTFKQYLKVSKLYRRGCPESSTDEVMKMVWTYHHVEQTPKLDKNGFDEDGFYHGWHDPNPVNGG